MPAVRNASQPAEYTQRLHTSLFLLVLDSNCSVCSVPRVQFFLFLSLTSMVQPSLSSIRSVCDVNTHNTYPHCFNPYRYTQLFHFFFFFFFFSFSFSFFFILLFHHLNVFFDFCFIPDYLFIYPFLQFSPDFFVRFVGVCCIVVVSSHVSFSH